MSSSANPEQILDNAGGLLGEVRGLSGTHNTFEVDGSNTRNDRYDPIGNVDGKLEYSLASVVQYMETASPGFVQLLLLPC